MLNLLGIGATHSTELPYVWANLDSNPKDITFRLGGRKEGEDLARRMHQRWRAFATPTGFCAELQARHVRSRSLTRFPGRLA